MISNQSAGQCEKITVSYIWKGPPSQEQPLTSSFSSLPIHNVREYLKILLPKYMLTLPTPLHLYHTSLLKDPIIFHLGYYNSPQIIIPESILFPPYHPGPPSPKHRLNSVSKSHNQGDLLIAQIWWNNTLVWNFWPFSMTQRINES